MPSIETGLLHIAGDTEKPVQPAIFLTRVIGLSPEFRDLMDAGFRLQTDQPMEAAQTFRRAAAFLESRVVASTSNQSARGYLIRLAFRLEDRAADRICREAIENAHLQRPIAKPPQVGYPLGIRNPGAVVRGGRHLFD